MPTIHMCWFLVIDTYMCTPMYTYVNNYRKEQVCPNWTRNPLFSWCIAIPVYLPDQGDHQGGRLISPCPETLMLCI